MVDPRPITSDRTVLAGLIGEGIGQSRTPAMHEAEARAQGFGLDYRFLDTATPALADLALPELLERLEAEGYAGVNVTYPFKMAVVPLLTALSPNASAVGAVNTIIFRNGQRIGHNTDLWGFAESFRRGLGEAARAHVLLVGAGGAGVAVAHALADCGVGRLSIHDSDGDRARALVAQVMRNRPGVAADALPDLSGLSPRPDGIVNATPVGMAKLPGCAVPEALLDPRTWVADIVYFPLETQLLRTARARGCRTLPGSGMAVFQAVRAFELFTGRPADPDRMKARFDAFDQDPAPARTTERTREETR